MTFQPHSVLLDKGVVRRVYEVCVRLALGQPPTLLHAEAANAYARLRAIDAQLYITEQTEHILQRRPPVFATALLNQTQTLRKARYLLRSRQALAGVCLFARRCHCPCLWKFRYISICSQFVQVAQNSLGNSVRDAIASLTPMIQVGFGRRYQFRFGQQLDDVRGVDGRNAQSRRSPAEGFIACDQTTGLVHKSHRWKSVDRSSSTYTSGGSLLQIPPMEIGGSFKSGLHHCQLGWT